MPLPPPAQLLPDEFARRFGCPCRVIARAPGRVNLIGEHTDYNDGFVLPMALEQCTWTAVAPRDDGRVRAVSLDLADEQNWPLNDWTAARYPDWTSYLAGVAVLLRRRGVPLTGCDVLIHSDVPVGGGLSSSAALEVSTALALVTLAGQSLQPAELADLARAAEHQFAEMPCGIMDQYISVLGRADCALLLDCRARTWEHIPLPLGDHTVLIVNSGVKHKLAGGEYALRQQQCRAAVAYFQRINPQVRALRDVDAETVCAHAAKMGREPAARALHVVTENQRTLAAADALRRGDLPALGRLLGQSHRSLRDDYQVSCRELDRLVEIVAAVPGVLGARMTGGGFGGCIAALVRRDCIPQIEAALREQYDGAGFGPARLIQSRPGPGAAVVFTS